jgi:hypothetical protein
LESDLKRRFTTVAEAGKHNGLRSVRRLILPCFVLLCLSADVSAQRLLHWDSVEIDATLDDAGHLRVVERQNMVFTGDWNGGFRSFDLRPRQRLAFISLSRSDGGQWHELTEDPSVDDVDEYAWTDDRTIRWRSRRPFDPPFAARAIQYQLRYELSGILLKEGEGYLLDHDFLFPDRSGTIDRFALRLTLAPSWTPLSPLRDVYMAEQLAAGRSFVVRLPLQYKGSGEPAFLDESRPGEIVGALSALLGISAVALGWFFLREQAYGRFAPMPAAVDEAWLREHILKYPAEVVGAAWDEGIEAPEVVALIARMVAEGKLQSEVGRSSMTLQLLVDRRKLAGHERTLVDGLFFNGRTTTSTSVVKQHYREKGFDPAGEIKRELEAQVEEVLPQGRRPLSFGFVAVLVLVAGLGALLFEAVTDRVNPGLALGIGIASLVLAAFAWAAGSAFRARIDWGRRAALACLTPALIAATAAAVFLWSFAGTGAIEASVTFVLALVTLALAVLLTSIEAMKSRRHRAAIAFRKMLAAGRAFFISELGKDHPALRDEWFPWILAFGLGNNVDEWSTRQASSRRSTSESDWLPSSTSSPSSSSSTSASWTGFTGGRSGGAGAGASWAAAAGGMAAGVAAPSSSGSNGGGGGGGSSGGSSSSGGGGGGGW